MIEHKKLIVIPQSLRQLLLEDAHDLARHPGMDRTLIRLMQTAYWVGVVKDVGRYCSYCMTCSSTKTHPKPPAPLQPVIASRHWKWWLWMSYKFQPLLGVIATSWWHKTTSPSGPLQCQYLTRDWTNCEAERPHLHNGWPSIQIKAVTLKIRFLQISARPSRSLHVSLALHPTTPWEMACWKEWTEPFWICFVHM